MAYNGSFIVEYKGRYVVVTLTEGHRFTKRLVSKQSKARP
jgi:hypothetical protein